MGAMGALSRKCGFVLSLLSNTLGVFKFAVYYYSRTPDCAKVNTARKLSCVKKATHAHNAKAKYRHKFYEKVFNALLSEKNNKLFIILNVNVTKILVVELNLIRFGIVGVHFFFHNVENSVWCVRFKNLQNNQYFQTTLWYWRPSKGYA